MNPCIFRPNCLRFFWSFFPFLTKLPCLLFIPDITYLQNLSYDLTDKNNPPFQMLHIFLAPTSFLGYVFLTLFLSLSLVPEGIKETYEHVMVKFFYYDHLLRKSSYLFMIYGR